MPQKKKTGIGKEKGEMWFQTTFPKNGAVWIPLSLRPFFQEGEKIRVTLQKSGEKNK